LRAQGRQQGKNIYRGSAIIGWTVSHTSAHFFRMLTEGLAFEAREKIEGLEEDFGQRIDEVRICGNLK